MSYDLLNELREAVDGAVERDWSRAKILREIEAIAEEVREDPEILDHE